MSLQINEWNYLPRGILESILCDFSGADQTLRPISVSITVGLTVFTRIPCGPNSKAMTLVRASTAPLEAQYAAWSFRAAYSKIREIVLSANAINIYKINFALISLWVMLIFIKFFQYNPSSNIYEYSIKEYNM